MEKDIDIFSSLPVIDEYNANELLGSGVFGKVYLSKDPATGKYYDKCSILHSRFIKFAIFL